MAFLLPRAITLSRSLSSPVDPTPGTPPTLPRTRGLRAVQSYSHFQHRMNYSFLIIGIVIISICVASSILVTQVIYIGNPYSFASMCVVRASVDTCFVNSFAVRHGASKQFYFLYGWDHSRLPEWEGQPRGHQWLAVLRTLRRPPRPLCTR